MMASSEDYGKYFFALGSRSVRRVTAKVYAAAELDAEVRIAMMKELTQAVTWQRMAALAGWPLNDHIADDKDGEEGAVEIDWAVYSDGRPVFTVVDWMDGYATSRITLTRCSPKPKTPASWRRRCAPVAAGCPLPDREPMTTGTSTLQRRSRRREVRHAAAATNKPRRQRHR